MKKEAAESSDDRAKRIEERLQELNRKIGREPDGAQTERKGRTGYGQAFRLSSEFISAILVGLAIGYGLDVLIGSTPWAMIVLLLLGFVAGIMNVLRAAERMSRDTADENRQHLADRDES